MLIVACSSGCGFLAQSPPFRYVEAYLTVGEAEGCHHLLGINYTLRNESDREIARVHASFLLYDSTGAALVLPGGNRFEITSEGCFPSGDEASFCTSLDDALFYLPDEEIFGEQFHVHDVDFADGGTWRDNLGLYVYPYPIRTKGAGGP